MTRSRGDHPVHSIFEALIRDHRVVAGLITLLEGVGSDDPAERADLFTELQERLLAHGGAEELALYAPLSRHEPLAEAVRQARADHGRIERLIDEIGDLDPEAPEWEIRVEVLRELVTRHVDAEEGLIFDLARPLLDAAESSRLADEFEAALRSLRDEHDDDDDDDSADDFEGLDEVAWHADTALQGPR